MANLAESYSPSKKQDKSFRLKLVFLGLEKIGTKEAFLTIIFFLEYRKQLDHTLKTNFSDEFFVEAAMNTFGYIRSTTVVFAIHQNRTILLPGTEVELGVFTKVVSIEISQKFLEFFLKKKLIKNIKKIKLKKNEIFINTYFFGDAGKR